LKPGLRPHLIAEAQVSLTILDQSSRQIRNFADCRYPFVNPQDVSLPDVSYHYATSDIVTRALPVAENVREIELPVWDSSDHVEDPEKPFTEESLGPTSNSPAKGYTFPALPPWPLAGDPQLPRSIGNKERITKDEAIPVAEPGGARSACSNASPWSSPRTPMPEERIAVKSITDSRNALLYVEGSVPWKNLALPKTLGSSNDFDLPIETKEQPKEQYVVYDWAAIRITSPDAAECSDMRGRFRTSRQRCDATESKFAFGRFSGSALYPDDTESRAASIFGDEPCQRQIQARSLNSNCLIEGDDSFFSFSSGSQSSVSKEGTSIPKTAESATTAEADPLSCTTCHKSFARPCELT
jgi:hypothetical protein